MALCGSLLVPVGWEIALAGATRQISLGGASQSAPQCDATIDEASAADEENETGVQRRFIAQCEAVIVEEPNVGGRWVEVARTMSIRYYGENGPIYLEPTMSWKRWLIRLDPVNVKTWQGIAWPKRYLEGDAVGKE